MTLLPASLAALRAVAGAGRATWHLAAPQSRAALAYARWYRRRSLAIGGPSFWPHIGQTAAPAGRPRLELLQWELARRAWLQKRPAISVLPDRIAELTRIGLAVVPDFAAVPPGRPDRLQRVAQRARQVRAAASVEQVVAVLGTQLQRVVVLCVRAARASVPRDRIRARRLAWLVLADVTLQLVALAEVGVAPEVDALLATVPVVARSVAAAR